MDSDQEWGGVVLSSGLTELTLWPDSFSPAPFSQSLGF